MPSLYTYLLLLLPLLLLLLPFSTATTCKDHPAYTTSLKPVLVSQWDFSNPSPTAEQSAYLRRHKDHVYAPYSNQKSKVYAALDLFHPLSAPHRSIRMSFQRQATVYIFADVTPKNFKPQRTFRLPGWQSVGWAVLISGKPQITYGVHQKLTRTMPAYVYVFKKKVKETVLLPHTKDVRKAVRNSGAYKVWIAEANGKPSPDVGKFKAQSVKSNERCPDSLHNVWVTKDLNTDDRDTRGKLFQTWHPAWDPCFWCAYDHDHGGNPAVFNYKPMYDYTAFKNGRQDEPNAGFKGFIFSFGKYWAYFNVHILASSLRRVQVRSHTMNIVVAEKDTKKVVADLRFKADFGFAAVQMKDRSLQPINSQNKRIRDTQKHLMFRTINILNPDKPDKQFLLKRDLRRGVYEEWQTVPMCTDQVNPGRAIQFTMKTPGTGILSLSKSGTPVSLGRTYASKFFKSLNLYRTVKFRRLTLTDEFCPQKKNGVFYTDPTGTRVVKGPSPNAVRQYIQPGFSMYLTGKHEVTDPWQGIYTKNKKGFFRDHGYGLDPNLS